MYKNVLLNCCPQWRKNSQLFQNKEVISEYLNQVKVVEKIIKKATVFNLGKIDVDSFFISEYLKYMKDDNTNTQHQSEFINKLLPEIDLKLPHNPLLLESSINLADLTRLSMCKAEIAQYEKTEINYIMDIATNLNLHQLILVSNTADFLAIKSFGGIFTTNPNAPFEKISISPLFSTLPLLTFSICSKDSDKKIRIHYPKEIQEISNIQEVLHFADTQTSALFIFLQFLKILQCKNVVSEVIPIVPLETLPKKQRRRIESGKRIPPEEYRILKIVLPGNKGNIKVGDGSKNNISQTSTPIDIRRGHFKTFTEDRPLFGRVTGTFWWQPISKTTSPSYQVKTK